MKHIKLFEELTIPKEDFPEHGYHELYSREKQILIDLVGETFLNRFEIRKEDNYYYTSYDGFYNQFESFNQLKDYIKFKYFILNKRIDSLLKLIKSTDLDPSFDNNHIITWACDKGYAKIADILLKDPRVDPSDMDNHIIQTASVNGHSEIVKVLLKDTRFDPAGQFNTPILFASQYGHTEVVKLLLQDPRVDPSDVDNYAIRMSSKFGHTEIVKLLLKDPRVDPSDIDNYAISVGNKEIVRLLIRDERVRAKLTPQEINKYTNETY